MTWMVAALQQKEAVEQYHIYGPYCSSGGSSEILYHFKSVGVTKCWIFVVLVFDGARHPMKAETNNNRTNHLMKQGQN